MTPPKLLTPVPWLHVAQGPFVVDRVSSLDEEQAHSIDGFVQAMEYFWQPIPEPGYRTVIDASGFTIVSQVTGPYPEFWSTKEVRDWSVEFVPGMLNKGMAWLALTVCKWLNGQEN